MSPPACSPQSYKSLAGVCRAEYVAPEVLLGRHASSALGSQVSQPYGPGCDVWSCGVVLYMLLSGCPPFWHEDVEQLLAAVQRGKFDFEDPVWRGVSREAKDLISGLLQFDPGQRLSCDEVRGFLPHAHARLLARGVATGPAMLFGCAERWPTILGCRHCNTPGYRRAMGHKHGGWRRASYYCEVPQRAQKAAREVRTDYLTI